MISGITGNGVRPLKRVAQMQPFRFYTSGIFIACIIWYSTSDGSAGGAANRVGEALIRVGEAVIRVGER